NCQASNKRKSLMRKHEAFLYAASVMLNASEQNKRLEADFHIAPERSENGWQGVLLDQIPAKITRLCSMALQNSRPNSHSLRPALFPVKHFHLSYSCSTFSPFLVIVGCLDV
ncbi:hypothetical protein, partial [Cronobacter malonaticus]|uniref:hypothetical protein n=2 Tax=Cronobacter malonaticus TaxID=413503 RepID=UPI001C852447